MFMPHNDPLVSEALYTMEQQIEEEWVQHQTPGMAIAVVHKQETIWSRGFGYADEETQSEATPETVWEIGSLTKLFTATVLLHLRDAGMLQLDDPVQRYLPGFTMSSRYDDGRPITLRQLASHSSGLPREAPLPYFETLRFPSIDQVLESLPETEAVAPPMTEAVYSNLGYAILGHALEQAAGMSLEGYLAQHVLDPLGMTSTGFEPLSLPGRPMATGYTTADERGERIVAPTPDAGAFAPSGGLRSSVADLARFVALQFRHGPAAGNQILAGTTLREMHAPALMRADWQGGTSLGWTLLRIAEHAAIAHAGATFGFAADMALIPRLKLGIAICTNSRPVPSDISDRVLSLLAPVFEAL